MTQFSTRNKILIFCGLWVVALIATDPTLKLAPLIYMFPLGLWRPIGEPNIPGDGWTALIVAAGVYVADAVLFFRSKKMGTTLIWLALLIILLIINVAGCRDMNHPH